MASYKSYKMLQVLLVTSSRRPDNWIVPGGGVEPEEEPSVTAVREVLEEAGVIGKLGRCLGIFEVHNYYFTEYNRYQEVVWSLQYFLSDDQLGLFLLKNTNH